MSQIKFLGRSWFRLVSAICLTGGLSVLCANTFATEVTPNIYNAAFIYGVSPNGILKWYKHLGKMSGDGLNTPGAWQGARNVGVGWQNFKQVFPGGGNTIYAIANDGTLKWYRHNGFNTGASINTPGAWDGAKDVGVGWQNFKQVFPGSDGVFYAIAQDGTLKWYRHDGYKTGMGVNDPGSWEGPKDVGVGWQDFKQVFSACDGIIYGVAKNGDLLWYKHKGYQTGDGLNVPGSWEGPKKVGVGWQDFLTVFALMPATETIN